MKSLVIIPFFLVTMAVCAEPGPGKPCKEFCNKYNIRRKPGQTDFRFLRAFRVLRIVRVMRLWNSGDNRTPNTTVRKPDVLTFSR